MLPIDTKQAAIEKRVLDMSSNIELSIDTKQAVMEKRVLDTLPNIELSIDTKQAVMEKRVLDTLPNIELPMRDAMKERLLESPELFIYADNNIPVFFVH